MTSDRAQQAIHAWVARRLNCDPGEITHADLSYSEGYYYSELTNADPELLVTYQRRSASGDVTGGLIDLLRDGLTPVDFLEECLAIYGELS